jgi:SecD/SecF fusion protein
MSFGELSTIEAPTPQAPAGSPGAAPASEAKSEAPASAPAAEDAAPAASQPDESPAAPDAEKPAAAPSPSGEPSSAPKTDAPAPSDAPQSSALDRNRGAKFRLASLRHGPALAVLAVAQDQPPAAAESASQAAAPAAQQPPAESKADEPATPATGEKPAGDADKPAGEAPAAASETPAAEAAPAEAAAAPAEGAGIEEGSLVGGTRVSLKFPQSISYGPLSEMIKSRLSEMKLSNVGFVLSNPSYKPGSDAPYSDWTLEIGLDQAQTRSLLEVIQQQLSATPVFPSSNQIGGKVAGDTQLMALYAILASLVMIVVYIWIRFQSVVFGLAGVVALVHDVLIAMAFLAVSYYLAPYLEFLMVDPFKISLTVVAALLTIVGYSINDKIVIFDRIREVRGKSPELTEALINTSLNQTLSRTILTGGAVIVSTLILYFVGGPGIHAFAITMFVGVVAGTYSSIYIAAPMLLWMKRSVPAREPSARAAAPLGADARRASA